MSTTPTTDKKKLENDPRFKFGPPPIQTAEDAMQAYLREEISEDEFESAIGRFGHTQETLWVNPVLLERPDDAFERTLPEHVFQRTDTNVLGLEDRLKLAEAKAAVREAAAKASEKVEAKVEPHQSEELAKNEAAAKAAAKPQEKLDDLAGKLVSETTK